MSSNVLSLVDKTTASRCNAEAVELLEGALARARSGEIVGVALACVTADNGAMTECSTSDKATLMLGAVVRLLHRIQCDLD